MSLGGKIPFDATLDEVTKKLLELSKFNCLVETKIWFFRVCCSKRGFAIQDFRDGEWYRFSTVEDMVSKLVEFREREKRISEQIRADVRSLHEQERWERQQDKKSGGP